MKKKIMGRSYVNGEIRDLEGIQEMGYLMRKGFTAK